MGGLFSKARASNEVDAMIKAGISVATSVTQKCFPRVAQVQGLSFNNIVGNIDLEGLVWDQIVVLDASCLSSASVTTNVQQNVTQQLQQMASALVGALSLGQTDADNVMKSSMEIATNISTAFGQICATAVSQQQTIAFDGHVGNIRIGFSNFSQAINLTQKCVQDVVSSSQAVQDLKQILEQKASAKNAGLLDFLTNPMFLLIAAAVIGLVVLGPMFLGGGGGGKISLVGPSG